MLNRATQTANAGLAFKPLEIKILQRLAPDSQSGSSRSRTLQSCLIQLPCLGGYLKRAKDPPPGNIVTDPFIK
jgi:hypothetical protein